MRVSLQPLLWYVGVAVVEPLVNGAQLGQHLLTTTLVATGCFVVVLALRRAKRR